MQILIVGSGLFGSAFARYLDHMGKEDDYILIDSSEPYAASKCSAGVWTEGWIGKIKEKVNVSLPILQELGVEIKEIELDEGGVKKKFNKIDCRQILVDTIWSKLTSVKKTKGNRYECLIEFDDDSELESEFDVIVFCVGAYTDTLLPELGFKVNPVEMDTQWGKVLHLKNKGNHGLISTWAPYKQMYCFEMDNGDVYFGDGCMVKNPKEADPRIVKNDSRILAHAKEFGLKSKHIKQELEGWRPYLRKGAEHINEHDIGVYSATGGAKNGTVLSGWIAKTLFDKIYGI